jgi:inner membrane protein
VVDDEHYYEGFYSVFDEDETIRFERYPRSPDLLETLSDSWPVQRLQWFTKGFSATGLNGDGIVITDLRMGLEPVYEFRFKVGEMGNPHPKAVPVERLPGIRNYDRLGWVWARIWDEQAQFPQGNGDGTAARPARPTS